MREIGKVRKACYVQQEADKGQSLLIDLYALMKRWRFL